MKLSFRWHLSLSLAGALAAFVTDGFGVIVARHVSEDSEFLLRVAMLCTGAVEGLIFGMGQAWVLGAALGISRRRWVAHTSAAFLGAWLLGSLLSDFESASPPSFGTLLLIAGAAGLALGAALGLQQGRLLRDAGCDPLRWALVSALGWASALVIAAIAADFVPWGAYGPTALLISVSGGALGGLVLAAVCWSTLRGYLHRP